MLISTVKNYNFYLLIFLPTLSFLILQMSCSNETPTSQSISGHSLSLNGVAHSQGLDHAERYCSSCHGQNLVGGDKQEPSCYSCHGENWQSQDPELSFAPNDHTELQGLWYHNPGLNNPEDSCVSCHGSLLLGDRSRLTPSCLTCHKNIWD